MSFEIAMATCAESARLPPPADAPPTAFVVIASVPWAVIVRLVAPVSVEPSARPAALVSLTTLTATAAPMPVVLPSLDCLASAVAWLVRLEVDASVKAPFTTTPVGVVTWALVLLVTTLTAIDPATPTLLPPAPEVAWAEKLELLELGASASTLMEAPPFTLRVALPER